MQTSTEGNSSEQTRSERHLFPTPLKSHGRAIDRCGPQPRPAEARGLRWIEPVRAPNAVMREQSACPFGPVWTTPTDHPRLDRVRAEPHGCSHTLVRRRIIQAFLKPYADRTLDPRLVGSEW